MIGLMLYVSAKKAEKKHVPAARIRNRNYAERQAASFHAPSNQGASTPGLPEQEPEEHISLVSCVGRTIPSPERPVTDTDAVIVDLIRQAPELPSAVLELSRLLRDPDAQLHAIVKLVSTDPVLSAKILRVTNSAAYGLQKITSLQQAIVLLGFNNIWVLIHQLMTSHVLQPFARLEKKEMTCLWRHAAAVAVCAKSILLSAGYATHETSATVITCALMHDVGKFLLRGLQPLQKEHEYIASDGENLLPAVLDEDERYGINHCRLGYLLSTYWKLPEQVCTAIGFHHHASFDNWMEIPRHILPVVAIVAMSDCLASYAGFHDARPVAAMVRPEVFKAAGLKLDNNPAVFFTPELEKDLKRMETLIKCTVSQ